jgi:F0F1-type ATP synthase assembly protein I
MTFANPKNPKAETESKNETSNNFKMWSLAWELGYLIALPIIILALLGRFLDKKFITSPLFLLVGILLALVITGFLVWKKIRSSIE